MTPGARARRALGFTLIELIVSIVIISIAVTAVLGVLSDVSARSGESMVEAQAAEIGSAYLNQVLANPFANVSSYNGLVNVGARDQYGNAVAGLSQFTVNVQVVTPPAGSLGAVLPANMLRVTVTVTHVTGTQVILSGYRTAYP